MVRFLLTLFLIIGINYLMGSFRRRIFSRPAGGPARTERRADPGDELVLDPHCLTYLAKKNALTVRAAGATRHFCSPECARAFEKG